MDRQFLPYFRAFILLPEQDALKLFMLGPIGEAGWIGLATSIGTGFVVGWSGSYRLIFSVKSFKSYASLRALRKKYGRGNSYIFLRWMMIQVQDCWLECITAFLAGRSLLSGIASSSSRNESFWRLADHRILISCLSRLLALFLAACFCDAIGQFTGLCSDAVRSNAVLLWVGGIQSYWFSIWEGISARILSMKKSTL